MEVINVQGLTKSFGENAVLRGIDFTVDKGETVAVIGPSGGGKSTMLRCLINLEVAEGGSIAIEGEYLLRDGVYAPNANAVCARMGMVFQNFHLFPHLSVMENLTLAPLCVAKREKGEVHDEARALLKKVGLSDKEGAMPSSLSGGQKQRVAIARALMMHPDMLLFDEPTSSLDPQLTGEVLAVMKALVQERMTMVVVTHEMGFAREAADRIIYIDEGVILENGTPAEIFENPKHESLRSFINSIL